MERQGGLDTEYCTRCKQVVDGPGPWCVLYFKERFCVPVMIMRRAIYRADSEGDGALVNALCWDLRRRTNNNFVP